MIIVTGASGFIGSCLLEKLNKIGYNKIVLVDDFSSPASQQNIVFKQFEKQIDKSIFLNWLALQSEKIEVIFHFGAISDTTITDKALFDLWNFDFSKSVWEYCCEHKIPLIYASSAATYGDGTNGFDDNESNLINLKPLNPYGHSKHQFDLWALNQAQKPPFWIGLKFFNVFGPNEYHKGKMASMVFHAYNQIVQFGYLNLFKSYKKEVEDGNQLRDFIYIKDIVDICIWLYENQIESGIYNIGTGQANSFNTLGECVFKVLETPLNINYIEMPESLKEKYQYFTQANIYKLRKIGYKKPFFTIYNGIEDYINNYLKKGSYY